MTQSQKNKYSAIIMLVLLVIGSPLLVTLGLVVGTGTVVWNIYKVYCEAFGDIRDQWTGRRQVLDKYNRSV